MDSIRDRYHAISFRGRLLLLLVAVSLIQASVAAYTFFELQSRPAEQRVEAQLNAAMRGIAPVLDTELQRSVDRLTELHADPSLQASIESAAETGQWGEVEPLLGNPTGDATLDGTDAAGTTDDASAFTGEGDSIASDGPVTADVPDESEGAPTPVAYVTDANGKVVAGTRPDGLLVEQEGVTSTRLMAGSRLIAAVHAPVAIDREFLTERIASYVPRGVDVFLADDEDILSSAEGAAGAAHGRPSALREGLAEIEFGGTKQLALTQSLLDGSVLVGASIPADRAAAQKREGVSSLWGFILLLVVMTIGVSWFITRAVGDALRKFADIARELAGGELGRRIPVTGEDEIAVLSSSFNEMAENLQDRIESLVAARASMRRQVDLFGEALANATEIDEMLQAVCSLAMESTSATHARFWTLDADGHYEHAACIGLRPNDTEPCGLEKAVPIRNASVRGDGSPHWLVVPSRMRDGQIVGLLTLVSTAGEFADDDLRIAERIAVQAAVAIDNARLHEQLRMQATRDGLTGLPNHRSLQDELGKRVAEAYQSDMPLGVCMLDIDNFKRVNDTYGHPVGDEAIKLIGRTLAHGVGGMGMVGRYGGEEFVVIMPGCDADAAVRIADRLREDITHIEIPLEDGTMLRVTSSFGVSNVDQQNPGARVDSAELLHQCDVGLYNAKRTGKNRVYLAGPDTTVLEMSEAEKAKLAARERGDVAAEQAAAAALETNPPGTYDPLDLAA